MFRKIEYTRPEVCGLDGNAVPPLLRVRERTSSIAVYVCSEYTKKRDVCIGTRERESEKEKERGTRVGFGFSLCRGIVALVQPSTRSLGCFIDG